MTHKIEINLYEPPSWFMNILKDADTRGINKGVHLTLKLKECGATYQFLGKTRNKMILIFENDEDAIAFRLKI